VQVLTLDLSRFIFEHIANAEIHPQRVLMKMEIKGSEYAVLCHMLATDSFSHIHLLTIEFHSWKDGSTSKQTEFTFHRRKPENS